MEKVCCIIVTYNRCKYLDVLLKALKGQTYNIDGFIIINNASNDNTINCLIENDMIDDSFGNDNITVFKKNSYDVYFYNSTINTGGAGGFKKGFEIAHGLTDIYKYFWIMDDDINPRENCLDKCIERFNDSVGVVVPRRIGEGFKDSIVTKYRFTNPFVHLFLDRIVQPKNMNKVEYEVKTFTFEGPIIKNEILKNVGLPNDRYFLQADDYDYAFRCLKYTKILYLTNAVIDRQIPMKDISYSDNLWRLYYALRNLSLLDLRYSKNAFFGRIRVLNNQLKWFLIGLKHHNKKERFVVKKAFKDALKNIDGKIYGPGEI